jgi:hypothetical protein
MQSPVPSVTRSQKKKNAKAQQKVQTIFAPSATGQVVVASEPKVTNLSDDCIVVSNREFLTEITGATQFTVSSFSLNPGLPAIFPWLFALASRYESYKFRNLKFVYVPQVSTTSAGFFGMFVDYDPNDPAPPTKAKFMSNKNAMSSPVWSSVEMPCSLKDLSKRTTYFTRSGAENDLGLYDVGNLFIAAEGSSGTLGSLYVEYDVEFMTPQISVGPLPPSLIPSARLYGSTGVTISNILGSSPSQNDNIGIVIDPTDSMLSPIQAWDGLITVQMAYDSGSGTLAISGATVTGGATWTQIGRINQTTIGALALVYGYAHLPLGSSIRFYGSASGVGLGETNVYFSLFDNSLL